MTKKGIHLKMSLTSWNELLNDANYYPELSDLVESIKKVCSSTEIRFIIYDDDNVSWLLTYNQETEKFELTQVES